MAGNSARSNREGERQPLLRQREVDATEVYPVIQSIRAVGSHGPLSVYILLNIPFVTGHNGACSSLHPLSLRTSLTALRGSISLVRPETREYLPYESQY